jgi:thiamine-phosphate pyrophosphorylase
MIRCYVTDRRQGNVLASAARAVREGVEIIQVREKDLSGKELFDLVCKVRDLAANTKTQILVNDRLDIALASAVDGVHLPGNGLPAARVRPFVKYLGVSVHTLEEALEAQKAAADFVIFGPIFDTPGKNAVGLDPLRKVALALKIPVLGIGGITKENTEQVIAAGATGIAAIRLFQ